MKRIIPALFAPAVFAPAFLAITAAGCASTSDTTAAGASATPSPNLAEQQTLLGARAGDNLPNGAETYVDGERVGGGEPDQPQR